MTLASEEIDKEEYNDFNSFYYIYLKSQKGSMAC